MNGSDNNAKAISILRTIPQLRANLEIAKCRMRIVEIALKTLTTEEKRILEKLIVNGEESADVSYALNIEHSTLYRKRNRALDKFSNALYGCEIIGGETEKGGVE